MFNLKLKRNITKQNMKIYKNRTLDETEKIQCDVYTSPIWLRLTGHQWDQKVVDPTDMLLIVSFTTFIAYRFSLHSHTRAYTHKIPATNSAFCLQFGVWILDVSAYICVTRTGHQTKLYVMLYSPSAQLLRNLVHCNQLPGIGWLSLIRFASQISVIKTLLIEYPNLLVIKSYLGD